MNQPTLPKSNLIQTTNHNTCCSINHTCSLLFYFKPSTPAPAFVVDIITIYQMVCLACLRCSFARLHLEIQRMHRSNLWELEHLRFPDLFLLDMAVFFVATPVCRYMRWPMGNTSPRGGCTEPRRLEKGDASWTRTGWAGWLGFKISCATVSAKLKRRKHAK